MVYNQYGVNQHQAGPSQSYQGQQYQGQQYQGQPNKPESPSQDVCIRAPLSLIFGPNVLPIMQGPTPILCLACPSKARAFAQLLGRSSLTMRSSNPRWGFG